MRRAGAIVLALWMVWVVSYCRAGDYKQAISCYRQGKITCAQQGLRAAISSGALKGVALAKAYFYLGMCYLAGGDEAGARECFSLAREAAPGFRPDPLEMAPKARRLWEGQGQVRVGVLPPIVERFGDNPDFDPDLFTALELVRELRARGIEAVGVDEAVLARVKRELKFVPGAYLLGKRLGLARLSLERLAKGKVLEVLSPRQVKIAAAVMKRLKVGAMVVWGVDLQEDGERVSVGVNLYLPGEEEPRVREEFELEASQAARTYPKAIADLLMPAF